MKEKLKKKFTFHRISYYLLIVTILLSCIANGIFAKFTTENSGGDGSRVADFGVIVNISGDLFATAYGSYAEDNSGTETAQSNNPIVYSAKEDSITVKSSNDPADNIVAPGTKNDFGLHVSVTGTPETDYILNYSIADKDFKTVFLSAGTAENGTEYGLMVQLDAGVVNEVNFKKLVEDGLYVGNTENPTTTTTYSKLASTATFESSKIYYKVKDTVVLEYNYFPIKYYVTSTPKTGEATKTALNTSYKGAANDYVESLLGKFATNTFGGGTANGSYYAGSVSGSAAFNTGVEIYKNLSLTWEWPYHQVDEAGNELAGAELDWCNSCDTILGYLAAGKNVVKRAYSESGDGNFTNELSTDISSPDYNLDVLFDYTITVTQVD